MSAALKISDIAIEIVRKDIKNVHLSVLPPNGAVRISAPRSMSAAAIRSFAISKLGWIRNNQKRLTGQERETAREFLDRESHYVWGRRYLLKLEHSDRSPSITLKHRTLVLASKPDLTTSRRADVLADWYRKQIYAALPPVIDKWEKLLGVRVQRVFVQKMRTKWGSANPARKTIRLNTELAKKPAKFLEYVVLHEMAHFLAPKHDERFKQLLTRHLPAWQRIRDELNASSVPEAS